jgi:hypothetical protein
MILLAAVRVQGLQDTGYEMNAAVMRALNTDNAEKR